jgi:hypothetical protein
MNKIIRPIRFARLEEGSRFKIFAEPSREIRKSTDQRVYIKMAESYSVNAADEDHAIILMPEDLVQPLTRGHK